MGGERETTLLDCRAHYAVIVDSILNFSFLTHSQNISSKLFLCIYRDEN